MSSTLEIIFGLVGGLAVFIYGMNFMGDGLKKIAGEKMKKILHLLTGNPIVGVIVGALATALMQSSSATTVMVVGFVSAGLMSLPQAISVVLGANIGTTVTAQIIAFDIGDYAYPIAALGFILYFAGKKRFLKNIGQTIFAFGLLFIGLNTMSSVMKPLAKNPMFTDMLMQIKDIPVLGLLSGTIMTLIAQSSSATIGVLQELASTPINADGASLMSLQQSIPVLLGSNIGTTITAILAAIGASKNAKRAALAHSMFNITGSVVFMFFIPIFATIVKKISPVGIQSAVISRQIANAHTSFNIVNTLIWLPLIGILAKFVTYLIKGEDKKTEKRTVYLDFNVLDNPAISMELASKELARMAQIARKAVYTSKDAFVNGDEQKSNDVFEMEETLDLIQIEIVNYLSTMLSNCTLNHKQSIRLSGLMHVAGDIERIGDYSENIAESALIKIRDELTFSDAALDEILETFALLDKMVDDSIKALEENNIDLAKSIVEEENQINDIESDLRERHLDRLNKGECNPLSGISFIELIHNLEKVADHCNNIAESIIEYNSESNIM